MYGVIFLKKNEKKAHTKNGNNKICYTKVILEKKG
jgi:hypothetical protein